MGFRNDFDGKVLWAWSEEEPGEEEDPEFEFERDDIFDPFLTPPDGLSFLRFSTFSLSPSSPLELVRFLLGLTLPKKDLKSPPMPLPVPVMTFFSTAHDLASLPVVLRPSFSRLRFMSSEVSLIGGEEEEVQSRLSSP